jgi:alpha-tubulin suppressor-like RCC1 family protein
MDGKGDFVNLLAWGKNKDGELALGSSKNANTPTSVKGIKGREVRYISSGGAHTAVVTTSGELFVCGSALHGKLGLEDLSMTNITRFQIVPALKGLLVREVACGDYHTLCLLETGVVYAWGGTLHKVIFTQVVLSNFRKLAKRVRNLHQSPGSVGRRW